MSEVDLDTARQLWAGGRKTTAKKAGGATKAPLPSSPIMLDEFCVFIPGMLTQSLNDGLRHNVGQKKQTKKRWQDTLGALLQPFANQQSIEYRWRVLIERRSTKKLDKTNLYGSVKPLEDVLRDLRLFRDDDPDSIDLEVTQVVVKQAAVGMSVRLIRQEKLPVA